MIESCVILFKCLSSSHFFCFVVLNNLQMVPKSDLVKISSVKWPDDVLANGLDCAKSKGIDTESTGSAKNDICLLSGEKGLLDARKLWTINDGAIENFWCKGYVIDIFRSSVGTQDGDN